MAGILYNGENLELSSNESISIERYSGYFEHEIRADITLPIELPYKNSPKNRSLLRDLNIPQAILKIERISVFFEYAGRYFPAEMVLRSLRESLSVNLYFGKTGFSSFETYCNEIEIPNTKDLPTLYQDGISKVFPETDCYFPMLLATEFYDDPEADPNEKVNPTFEYIINGIDISTGGYRENVLDAQLLPDNRNTMVPMPALMRVLEAGFAQDNYTVSGSFYEDPIKRRLWVNSNLSLDVRVSPTIYEEVNAYGQRFSRNDGSGYLQQVITFDSVSNASIANNSVYLADEPGEFEFTFSCLNFVVNADVYVELIYDDGNTETWINRHYREFYEGDFGFSLTSRLIINNTTGYLNGNFFMRVRVPTGAAVNHQATAWRLESYKWEIKKLSRPLLNSQSPTNLGVHLPRVKFVDLIKAVMVSQCLRVNIDREQKVISFNYRDQARNIRPVQDLTPYFTGQLAVQFKAIKGRLYQYQPFGDFEKNAALSIYKKSLRITPTGQIIFLNDEPDPVEEEIIKLQTYPLLQRTVSTLYYTSRFNTLAQTGRGVSLAVNTAGTHLDKVRLGYFAGMHKGLPLAANDYQGHSLALDNTNQSVGSKWARWLTVEFNDNRVFIAALVLPNPFLDSLDLGRPVIIQDTPFIVVNLKAEIQESEEQEVELELKRL